VARPTAGRSSAPRPALVAVALAILGSLLFGLPSVGRAQDAPLAVPLQPVASPTTSGLATLTSAGTGTAVQLLVVGAPAGAIATIQSGTCAALDPTPTHLLQPLDDTGRSESTIPATVDELRQGFAIAIHGPQVELIRPLACGDIPAASGQAPTAPVAPTATATRDANAASYTSPTYGYVVSWEAPWRQAPNPAGVGADYLQLTNGTSTLTFEGLTDPGRPLEACPSDVATLLQESPSISELGAATDAAGRPIAGATSDRAWAGYRFTVALEGGAEEERVMYVECRPAGAGGRLHVFHVAPAAAYEAEVAAREQVLSTLSFGSVDPAVVTPTTPAQPTAPVTDPACVGVAEWRAAVDAVIEDWDALKREAEQIMLLPGSVETATSYLDIADRATLIAGDLARLIPPPTAAAAQESLLDAMQQAIDATYRQSLATAAADLDALVELDEEFDRIAQAEVDARRAVSEVTAACG
jgi:hypothetical protein